MIDVHLRPPDDSDLPSASVRRAVSVAVVAAPGAAPGAAPRLQQPSRGGMTACPARKGESSV